MRYPGRMPRKTGWGMRVDKTSKRLTSHKCRWG